MVSEALMSTKGQVVIPKASRDRLRLAPGARLIVVDTPDGVLFQRAKNSTESFDAITERIRARSKTAYSGPRFTSEEERAAIDEMFRTDPKYR